MANKRQYWIVSIVCFFLAAIATLASTGMGFFIGPVTKELGYGRAEFSLFISFMTVATMLCLPVIGRMYDKFGFRKVIIFGAVWTVIGFASLSFCTSLISFYIAGAFLGVTAYGISTVAAGAIINTWFKQKTGTVLGMVMAASGVSAMIISMILPSMIASSGWRNGFLLLAAIAFICSLPAIFFLKNKPEDIGIKPYGYVESNKTENIEAENGTKQKASLPFITPKFICLYLAIIVLTVVAGGFVRHLPAFLGDTVSTVQVGQLMTVVSAALIAAKIIIGIVRDKIGTLKSFVVLLVMFIFSVIILASTKSFVFLAIALALFAFGGATVNIMPPLITREAYGEKDFSTIYAVLYTSSNVGTIIGAPFWGGVYDKTGSYNMALLAAPIMIIVVIGLVIYSLRVKTKKVSQILESPDVV